MKLFLLVAAVVLAAIVVPCDSSLKYLKQTACDTNKLLAAGQQVKKCTTKDGRDVALAQHVAPSVQCLVNCEDDETKEGLMTCTYTGNWEGDGFACRTVTSAALEVKPRQKRFLGFLVPSLIIGCLIFCRRSPPRDHSPPHLECPRNQPDVTAEPAQWSARVYYNRPTAHDDRDGAITPSLGSGYPSGWYFSEGTTAVKYYARDRSGNFNSCTFYVTVKVVRCGTPPAINDGYYSCLPSDDHRYGTKCSYGCFRGYELHGYRYSECLSDGKWSGTTPACKKVQCPTLKPIQDGEWKCTDGNNFRSICSLMCKAGYDVPEGYPRVSICSYIKIWRGGKPPCKDVEKPKFTECPVNQISFTESKKDTATVHFLHPKATDNSGVVNIKQVKGQASGSQLNPGTHVLEFEADDSAGNKAASCKFMIIVHRRTCPFIYPTPSLKVTCQEGYGLGAKCGFSCETGSHLRGLREASCTTVMSSKAVGWDWGDAQPSCEGTVCAVLPPPDNGAFACDLWLYGKFCQLLCRNGTDVLKTFQRQLAAGMKKSSLYVCGNKGTWSHTYIPDCAVGKHPDGMFFKSTYYFNGNCSGNATQEEIKAKYIKTFKESYYQAICTSQHVKCNVKNVQVTCGKTRLTKRDVSQSTEVVKVELEMSLDATAKGNSVQYKLIQALDKTAGDLASDSLIVDASKTEHSSLELTCPAGSVPGQSMKTCVECPSGTYYNAAKKSCDDCGRGTYQNEAGKLSCILCGAGKTTVETGSKVKSDCKDMCPAGTFSSNGVQPCSFCERGSYSSSPGQKTCVTCPQGTTTAGEKSDSPALCQAYDILFPPNKSPSPHATLSKNITLKRADFSVSVAFAFDQPSSTEIASLSLDGSSDGLLWDMSINTQLIVKMSGISVETGHKITDTKWHHVLLTYKDDEKLLTLYDRRVKVFHQTMALNYYASRIHVNSPVAATLTLGQSSGISFIGKMTNVMVWDRLVTTEEMYPPGGACKAFPPNAVVSWDEVGKSNMESVSPALPSLCDDVNECENSPCGDHVCEDLLNDYVCKCRVGFAGRNCEINVDECKGHVCENNATCVDGINEYTCSCNGRFEGKYCEIEIIDGGFSEFGNFSACSATCGGGVKLRRRLCDSPAPGPGGRNCSGNRTEEQACNTQPCPVCETLNAPVNGYLDCNETDKMKECFVRCRDNYEFSFPPLPVYKCGVDTFHQWNFKTKENPHGRLPACEEIVAADSYTIQQDLVYDGAVSCDGNDKERVISHVKQTVARVPCIAAHDCNIDDVTVLECAQASSRDKRSAPAQMTIRITLYRNGIGTTQEGQLDAATLQKVNSSLQMMETAGAALNDSASSGDMDVRIGDKVYRVNFGASALDGLVGCPSGMSRVMYYCVYCSPGTYEKDGYCELCPFATYQSMRGQTQCVTCLPGLSTAGTGSISSSECSVPVPTVPTTTIQASTELDVNENNDTDLLIATIIPSCLIVISIIIIALAVWWKKKYRFKKEKRIILVESIPRCYQVQSSRLSLRPSLDVSANYSSRASMDDATRYRDWLERDNSRCQIDLFFPDPVIPNIPPVDTSTSRF